MSNSQAAAVKIAVEYHQAWTTGRLDAAAAHLADDVICHAPSGFIEGKAAVRAFMEPFAASLTQYTLLAAFGTDEEALLMYNTIGQYRALLAQSSTAFRTIRLLRFASSSIACPSRWRVATSLRCEGCVFGC